MSSRRWQMAIVAAWLLAPLWAAGQNASPVQAASSVSVPAGSLSELPKAFPPVSKSAAACKKKSRRRHCKRAHA
ncbi:hypothetical protein [Chitinimonas sp.]|uniref:hypothetical protein n=1 Tax=Chitinimonas sp. TaxID=1934313 RepID=UPI0035AE5733